MRLYHYTSKEALRAVASHGLTIGDIPTAKNASEGVVGVWLTTSPKAAGKGLCGSTFDKTAVRLTVDLPTSPLLHRWPEWAAANAKTGVVDWLNDAIGSEADCDTWYVCFSWIRPGSILEVYDTATEQPIENWQECWPAELSLKPIRFRDRERWHKRLVRQIEKHLSR